MVDRQLVERLHNLGYSMTRIGNACGVCRQRIQQLVKRWGLPSPDMRRAQRRFQQRAAHERKAKERYDRRESRWQGNGRTNSDCWPWVGYINRNGYGVSCWNGRRDYAHRIAWRRANKMDIPLGMNICHRCDVPACVNPAHLFLGTQQENVQDSIAKGRWMTKKREIASRASQQKL